MVNTMLHQYSSPAWGTRDQVQQCEDGLQLAVSQKEIKEPGCMVGGELCIDRATFSLYLWRKAIQAQANPAASSFLLQPCTAGAGVTDPGFKHQPSGPHGPATIAGMGLAWGPARASRLGEAGREQPGSSKWLRKSHFSTLGCCYQEPGWRHCHQWKLPSHPKSLWRPGAPLCSVPHLPLPQAVTCFPPCS